MFGPSAIDAYAHMSMPVPFAISGPFLSLFYRLQLFDFSTSIDGNLLSPLKRRRVNNTVVKSVAMGFGKPVSLCGLSRPTLIRRHH